MKYIWNYNNKSGHSIPRQDPGGSYIFLLKHPALVKQNADSDGAKLWCPGEDGRELTIDSAHQKAEPL